MAHSQAAAGDAASQSEVFLSYSHEDRDKVLPLASYLGRLGLKVWLDTERLVGGDRLMETISNAIRRSDVYVLFLSADAVNSNWVRHELSVALTLEATQGKPRVLPVRLYETPLPTQLIDRLSVDATGTGEEAHEPLRNALERLLGAQAVVDEEGPEEALWISSARFWLFADTAREFGAPFGQHTPESVREEALGLLGRLRGRAQGILLNFVLASEMDWASPQPKFPNGQLAERIEELPGVADGAIRNRAIVEVEIVNPDESKLAELVSSQLADLGVLRVGYQFSFKPPAPDLARRTLERIQSKYPILSWDAETGVEIALPDDVRLLVRVSEELISVALETRYPFQLETRAKGFSVSEFVDWLRGGG